MDSVYLVFAILEAIRKDFGMATDVHLLLFPYFLFPGLSVAMTGSVFMTVGIALERYIAVHYPIDYSQAINSPEACRRRLLKYVFPVVAAAIVINLPRFFESETSLVPDIPNNDTIEHNNGSVTYAKDIEEYPKALMVAVTDLRRDPDYTIYYTNWTRLLIIGIIPMALLIYFNYKVSEESWVKFSNPRLI